LVIGAYLVIGLPARSRFGEGRCLEFGICLKMRHELKYRRILILVTVGLIVIPSYALGAPKAQFSIVYTNDVMGEVDPCG